jgi:pyrimidine operon attenuation protein/uracil phosphoribosyltransferase
MESLETTNILLGIMVVVSILEAVMLIGMGIAGWKAYRQFMDLANRLEERHVSPAMVRLNAVLDDLQRVMSTVKHETDRVDEAIHRTMDRVDDTAQRVRSTVVAKTSRLVGFIRGARVALETLLEDHNRNLPVRTH